MEIPDPTELVEFVNEFGVNDENDNSKTGGGENESSEENENPNQKNTTRKEVKKKPREKQHKSSSHPIKCSENKKIREFYAEEIEKKVQLNKASACRYLNATGSKLEWKLVKRIIGHEISKARKNEEKHL